MAKINKSDYYLIIGITVVVLVIIILLVSIRLAKIPKDVKTIDDLHEDVISGDGPENSYVLNGFSFVKVDGFWYTQIYAIGRGQKKGTTINFPMRYDPLSVLNISMEPGVKDKVMNSMELFLTLDEDASSVISLGAIELAGLVGERYNLYDIPTKGAVTSAETDETLLVKTCADATEDSTVIHFKVSDRNWISLDGDCVVVEGTSEWEVVRATEKLIYKILNVI